MSEPIIMRLSDGGISKSYVDSVIAIEKKARELADEELRKAVEDCKGTSITDEMLSYLNSKLDYHYSYIASINANISSIDLPSTIDEVEFTASFRANKYNDMGSTSLSVTAISDITSGWHEDGLIITKTVSVDPKKNSINSGSVSAVVTDSDGRTGTASVGALTIPFSKPWFVFETSNSTISNTTNLINELVSDSGSLATILKTDRSAVNLSNTSLSISKPYLWFAIPNTRSMGSVEQIVGLSSLESKTEKYNVEHSVLGNYKIYRWGGALANGTLIFNLKIN